MEQKIDKYSNNEEVWASIKDAFKKNPDEAKRLYALEMDYIRTLKIVEDGKGHSWFVGNCVVMHDCINAVARHMGIRDKVVIQISDNTKHTIEFKIGTAICKFQCGKATAVCYAEDKELVTKFINYFYPMCFVEIS